MDEPNLPPQPWQRKRERVATPPMPAEIARAISSVIQKVGVLAKNAKNAHGGYTYASVDAFYEGVAPVTAEEGLIIYPSSIAHEYDKITTADGNLKVAVTIEYSFTLVHVETGKNWSDPNDVKEIRLWWTGAQTFGAAESYAIKQFMRGLFKIPTGDRDADEDDQTVRIQQREGNQVNDKRRTRGQAPTSKTVAFDVGGAKRTLDLEAIEEELFPYLDDLSRDQLRAWHAKNEFAISELHKLDKTLSIALKKKVEDKLG
jgi:hypothetical protein